jgi:hypothetical protein
MILFSGEAMIEDAGVHDGYKPMKVEGGGKASLEESTARSARSVSNREFKNVVD